MKQVQESKNLINQRQELELESVTTLNQDAGPLHQLHGELVSSQTNGDEDLRVEYVGLKSNGYPVPGISLLYLTTVGDVIAVIGVNEELLPLGPPIIPRQKEPRGANVFKS